MTLKELQKKAEQLGYQDAKQGCVYRHSADPGSWLRNWLPEYERGWQRGRQQCLRTKV